MNISIETHSPAETQSLGQCLARFLHPGDVIGLEGDLGTGKTVLVQGLADGLGVTARVHSPTFVLHHRHVGRIPLEHYDLYRLGALEWRDTGLEEPSPESVTVIEWAERATPLQDWATITIRLDTVADQVRRLTCVKGADRVKECFARAGP